VRTPEACFEGLPGWPFEAKYVEIDGLRQAYADEGPAEGPVVLLLHGQPSWSYLYRKMIPVLVDGGYRVIAMDHLGMGRSDKPVDIADYSFLGHYARLESFIEELGLREINLFCQDWGSVLGLRVAGLHPDWFARIAVGDGTLPVLPAGVLPFPPVEEPNVVDDTLVATFAHVPAQQPVLVDEECELSGVGADSGELGGHFGDWMRYAMKAKSFRASEVVEAMTWFDLPAAVEAAYDAPFPSRIYMAGPRVFPSLANELPGVNDEAWAGLTAFTKPFLTLWAANDPGNLGRCETQNALIRDIPGAAGQPHARLPEASHFLQDDQGPEIARRLVEFFASEPLRLGEPLARGSRYCEVLLVQLSGSSAEAQVWGTQGLNDCPAEEWEALDPEAIKADAGAAAVVMNGPRYWLPDRSTGSLPVAETRRFGELEMRLLATVAVDPGQANRKPYAEIAVKRSTTFTFNVGAEIYELSSPEGALYVMQSMSQIVDPEQSLEDLAALRDRLSLPEGWTFTARTLETALVLTADGEAVVIQDELQNTYQRVTRSDSSGATPPPVLDDGTGTLCTDDSSCLGFAATHCLVVSGGAGICTIQGCQAGICGAPYLCCHGCREAVADLLPFEGSACIPEDSTSFLTGAAGCTCD